MFFMDIRWSKSRYEIANTCLMKYYFQYVAHIKPPSTPEQALGIFLHKRKEKMFKGKPGSLKLKHKSASSFANSAVGMWKHTIAKDGMIQGKPINWKFKGQPWAMINDIKDLCIKTYDKCASEKPPLFVEYEREFYLNGHHFLVKLDEIREGYTIREYKTGFSLPEEMELKHFVQFAFYALAFSCISHQDKEFARICGVNEEDAKSFGGNPIYIDDKINLEYYRVQDNSMHTTHLTNSDYFTLHNHLNELESKINKLSENLYPNFGHHCKLCSFQKECDEKTNKGEFHSVLLEPQLDLFAPKRDNEFKDITLNLFPRKRKEN